MKQNYEMVVRFGKLMMFICLMVLTSACGSSEVNAVKGGTLDFDNGITFGDAVDNFAHFGSTEWGSFEDSKGRKIVQVTGKAKKDIIPRISEIVRQTVMLAKQHEDYPVEDLEIIIQCTVNLDGESFDISYVGAKALTPQCGYVEAKGDLSWIEYIYKDYEAALGVAAFFCNGECNAVKEEFLYALRKKDLAKVSALLEKGLDINAKDRDGKTLFLLSVGFGDPIATEMLIEHGADVNVATNRGHTALMEACRSFSSETVIKLIEAGADVNGKDNDGKTVLMDASSIARNAEIVRELLSNGADVNAQDKFGNTALMFAASYGVADADIVKALLAADANTDPKNKDGNTTLMIAVAAGKLEIVRDLLAIGADINVKDKNGNTPFIIAVSASDGAIIKELLANGANVNDKDQTGNPALIIAMKEGYKDIIEMLLAAGADVHAKGKNGQAALERAKELDYIQNWMPIFEKYI